MDEKRVRQMSQTRLVYNFSLVMESSGTKRWHMAGTDSRFRFIFLRRNYKKRGVLPSRKPQKAIKYRSLNHREHTVLLSRDRVNKGTKRMNSLPLSHVVIS